MNTYDAGAHNTAMHSLIKSFWTLTGDAQKPADVEYDDQGLVDAYAVAYPIGAQEFDGSMAAEDVQGDCWPLTQVTYVGRTRDHADQLRTHVRNQLLGQAPTVAGRLVGPLRLDSELPVRRDEDAQPPVFYAIDRYRCYSTPT